MSESSTLPLDDSELEEARSSVLLGLPAEVPPTRPMVALEGLGGTGRFSSSLFRAGTGSSFQNQFGCVSVTLSGARFNPYLNFWEAGMGPLDVMMVR